MLPNNSTPYYPHKPKTRNTYEIHRVDMSQFLPELKPQQSEVRPINPNSRPKTLTPNYRIKRIPNVNLPSKTTSKQKTVENPVFKNQASMNVESVRLSNQQLFLGYTKTQPSSHALPPNVNYLYSIPEKTITETQDLVSRVKSFQRNDNGGIRQAPIDRNFERDKETGQNKKEFTQQELKEYQFLEKAQVLIMNNDSNPGSNILDEHSVINTKAEQINEAMDSIKEKFENNKGFDSFKEELLFLLGTNIQEMRSAVDFTEVNDVFCMLLSDNCMSIEIRMQILPFVFYFCEESLFSLSLDFLKIYERLINFIKHLYKEKDASSLPSQYISIVPNVTKACINLYKHFSHQFSIMDRNKLTIIFEGFLDMFLHNLDVIPNSKILNGELSDRTIPFLTLPSEFVLLLESFIKKIEIRQIILNEKSIRIKVINLINYLNDVIFNNFSSQDLDCFQNDHSSLGLAFLFYSAKIIFTIFKYSEMYILYDKDPNNENVLKYSVEDTIIQVLLILNAIIQDINLHPLLIQPIKVDEGQNNKNLCKLIDLLKTLFTNLKLYEDKKIIFPKVIDAFKNLETECEKVSGDTNLHLLESIENDLKKPLQKLQAKISKILIQYNAI